MSTTTKKSESHFFGSRAKLSSSSYFRVCIGCCCCEILKCSRTVQQASRYRIGQRRRREQRLLTSDQAVVRRLLVWIWRRLYSSLKYCCFLLRGTSPNEMSSFILRNQTKKKKSSTNRQTLPKGKPFWFHSKDIHGICSNKFSLVNTLHYAYLTRITFILFYFADFLPS